MDDLSNRPFGVSPQSAGAYLLDDKAMRSLLWLEMMRAYLGRRRPLPENLDTLCFDLLIALDVAQFEGQSLRAEEVAALAGMDQMSALPRLAAMERADLVLQSTDKNNPHLIRMQLAPDGLTKAKLAYRRFFAVLDDFKA
jgi:hypothetical protein